MRAASCALLVAVLASCSLQRSPTEVVLDPDDVTVSSVLIAGSDTVKLLLTRPADSGPTAAPLRAAVVRIIHGVDTVTLRNQPASECSDDIPPPEVGAGLDVGCHVGVMPAAVAAGGRYHLLIHLPSGRVITGSATVPAPPVLLEPQPPHTVTDAVDAPALRLAWTGSGDDLVQISARDARGECVIRFREGRFLVRRSLYFAGTDSADVSLTSNCNSAPVGAGIPVELVLTRFDSAYTRYFSTTDQRPTVRAADASIGVNGAFGVFAGAAHASVGVTLVRGAGLQQQGTH